MKLFYRITLHYKHGIKKKLLSKMSLSLFYIKNITHCYQILTTTLLGNWYKPLFINTKTQIFNK